MYIIDATARTSFIGGLRFRYARALPTKSIANRDDIMFAATHLYAYGTPFANRGKGKQPHYTSAHIPHLETVLDAFVDMVWQYFNDKPNTMNTQANFDSFHEKLCDEFVDAFRNDGVYIHTYGNAQKMVNILFKYLTCFSDYANYADLFSYCHIPIDGIILGKFALIYNVTGTKGTCYRGHYHGTYGGKVWSKMDRDGYMRLLADYRHDLASVKGQNSWLGVEYAVWPGNPIPTGGVHAPVIHMFYM